MVLANYRYVCRGWKRGASWVCKQFAAKPRASRTELIKRLPVEQKNMVGQNRMYVRIYEVSTMFLAGEW